MIYLGDDVPGAIYLDERVKVRIVGTNCVILHVDAHNRRRRCYREHVKPSLDVRRGAVLLDKFVEVFDWTAEQFSIGEAIHDGVLVESLGEAGDVANAYTIDILGDSFNNIFKVLGRHSLDIL